MLYNFLQLICDLSSVPIPMLILLKVTRNVFKVISRNINFAMALFYIQ